MGGKEARLSQIHHHPMAFLPTLPPYNNLYICLLPAAEAVKRNEGNVEREEEFPPSPVLSPNCSTAIDTDEEDSRLDLSSPYNDFLLDDLFDWDGQQPVL